MKKRCVITDKLAGPCLACRQPMAPAHLGEDPILGISTILCGTCCGCEKKEEHEKSGRAV